jgi:hypothetical protein
MDARSAPKWIRSRHLANEISDLLRDLWPSSHPAALPPPMEPESPSVPPDDRLGLDDVRVSRQPGQNRSSGTQRRRSALPRRGFSAVRWRTPSRWRRARLSMARARCD